MFSSVKLVLSAWQRQGWVILMVSIIIAIYPKTAVVVSMGGELWYNDVFRSCKLQKPDKCLATCNINDKEHKIRWINPGPHCSLTVYPTLLEFGNGDSLQLNSSKNDCSATINIDHTATKIINVQIPSFADDCSEVMHDVPFISNNVGFKRCVVNHSTLQDTSGEYFHLNNGEVVLNVESTIDYKCGPSNIKQSSTCIEQENEVDYNTGEMVPPVPDKCSIPIIDPTPASSFAPSPCIITAFAMAVFHAARSVMKIMGNL